MNAPLLTVDDYEAAARARLPQMAYDYFRSGADAERTLARNRDAFARYELWPRVLVDVSSVCTETTVLGAPVRAPILVAPTAYHRMAHRDGECGSAAAAADAATLFVMSTLATTTIEEVAAASPGPKWFQLYIHKDRALTRALVERAERCGFLAIVLTVDTPLLGRRLADERNHFALPPGLTMANLVTEGAAPIGGSMLASYFAARHDASLTFADLAWLRSITRLPIVVKGVLREDDARRCVDAGVAGIVVSNHGGRQLDGAPATIDALPGVVAAAAGRCEVYVDGGFRFGSDVLVALALGARAVLVGRPVLWGLAVAGRDGVRDVLALFQAELSRAMALAGCPDVASLRRDLVRLTGS